MFLPLGGETSKNRVSLRASRLVKTKGVLDLKRRKYDVDFKIRVAREVIETRNGTIVARRYEITPGNNRWASAATSLLGSLSVNN